LLGCEDQRLVDSLTCKVAGYGTGVEISDFATRELAGQRMTKC
jgi:hypothetical protein